MGVLVQCPKVSDSWLDMTFETKAKLLPRWSPPRIVMVRLLNSYTLCKLDGTEINGTTHAQCLRRFIPRHDRPLHQEQKADATPNWIWEWEEEKDETIETISELFGN